MSFMLRYEYVSRPYYKVFLGGAALNIFPTTPFLNPQPEPQVLPGPPKYVE